MGGHEKVILLDTHVLVWLTSEPVKLSKQASSAIRRANKAGGIAVSAITLWELAWLEGLPVEQSWPTTTAVMALLPSR